MSRTPRPYSNPKKSCQGFEVLFCTCSLTVPYLPAGTAHNPRTDNHCARHLDVLTAGIWGRFFLRGGIPTLQGAALAPLCFVPQRHRAVHAQLLPQLLSQEPKIPNPPCEEKPSSGSSSCLCLELWDTEAPCRERSCLPIAVPRSRKGITSLPELQLLAARWAHRDGFQLSQLAEGAAHREHHQLCTRCRVIAA